MTHRTFVTKYPRITSIRVHPNSDIFVAGSEATFFSLSQNLWKPDEVGNLLLFDLSIVGDNPRHCCTLSYEYGGVSELCWLDAEFLAVGTTRGKIVVFSILNDNVCSWCFDTSTSVSVIHSFLEAFGRGDDSQSTWRWGCSNRSWWYRLLLSDEKIGFCWWGCREHSYVECGRKWSVAGFVFYPKF